ncbi:MAG: hypothetical protein AB7Q17_16345 [Phycisphaerae bacterium]
MTSRERILAGCVAAAVGGFIFYQVARQVVYEPFRSARGEIATLTARRVQLRNLVQHESKTHAAWAEQTERTLSADPGEARLLFSTDLGALLDEAGLRDNRRIAPTAPQKLRNGQYEIAVNVNVSGTLEHFANFLRGFYQRPYAARLRSVVVTAEDPLGTSKSGGAAPTTPLARSRARRNGGEAATPVGEKKLRISFTAVAVVLPVQPDVAHHTLTENREEWPLATRLGRPLEDYAQLASATLFSKWTPPPARPPEPVNTEPVVANTAPPPPPPPPPPRPAHLKLVGSATLDGRPLVFVLDTNVQTEPPARYSPHDHVDDGTLVFIHPRGMVVRTEETTGGETQSVDYFYPLGKTYADRQTLDPSEHPDVWRAMYGRADGT